MDLSHHSITAKELLKVLITSQLRSFSFIFNFSTFFSPQVLRVPYHSKSITYELVSLLNEFEIK